MNGQPSDSRIGGIEVITELGISSDFPADAQEKECFSEPTLKSISKLGDVLKRIDMRMKREGFCIQSGKIVNNENVA